MKWVDTLQTGTLDRYAMTNDFKDLGNRFNAGSSNHQRTSME